MKDTPALFCNDLPAISSAQFEEFSNRAANYWHSIREIGGYWEAGWNFPLMGSGRSSNIEYLYQWFNNRLGCEIIERAESGISWRGIVWEMTLTLNGATWQIGLEDMYNSVRAYYGGTTFNTAVTDPESIARYGQKELVILMPDATLADADAKVATVLADKSWPRARLISFGNNRSGLEVRASGSIVTSQYKYLVQVGTGLSISAYVTLILDNDCEFFTAGVVDTNAIVTKSKDIGFDRVWETIAYYAELGDGVQPFTVETVNGTVNFRKRSADVVYHWDNGVKNISGEKMNKWLVQPKVIRDITRRKSVTPTGSFLRDGRDAVITEVRASAGRDTPRITLDKNVPEELLADMADHMAWLEKE